jgi:glycosyltransferase EpsF
MVLEELFMPIRVLHILPTVGLNDGISAVVMEWFRNIDRNKIQFDFVCRATQNDYSEEIKKLGGRIYYVNHRNPVSVFSKIKKACQNYPYSIVHSHLTHCNFFYLPILKIFVAKKIILQSHNSSSNSFLKHLLTKVTLFLVEPFISNKLAVSDLAGNYLFGSKSKYTIINNGIDVSKYAFNPYIRSKIRKYLNVEKSFVIGFVGRFAYQKNPLFLLDIFNGIYNKDKTAILLLVGAGNLKNKMMLKIQKLGIEKVVRFVEPNRDVYKLYQSMDIFVLPSFFEGFPVVSIEAQISGLKCFFSDRITISTDIVNVEFLSLEKGTKYWVDKIIKKRSYIRKDESAAIIRAGYSAYQSAMEIQNFYIKIQQHN